MRSVAEAFSKYRTMVMALDAPADQVAECRHAFYAAVHFTLLHLVLTVGDASTSEEAGIESLERLKDECDAYAESMVGNNETATDFAGRVLLASESRYTVPDPLEVKRLIQELGDRIGAELPTGWGFNLLLFSYGDKGSLFYISSARREDVIAVMREFIQRQVQ